MSILINKHRIMGLLAEIEGLSQSISGIDGVRRSGGVISGLLEIDGDLSISGDILFTESNFYIDQENRRFGINITTPSGQLHIYNSSGDAGMTFDGSGTNGLKFIVKSPDFDLFLNESGIADINHQDSGTFNFDRYSNDEGRVYSADGFHAGYNTFYQYMGTINSRVAFYGGMLDKTLAYQSPEGWTLVDGSGIGAGVVDRLRQLNFNVVDVNGGNSSLNPRFLNKRAEMWWEMKEFIEGLCELPKDEQLKRELTCVEYAFTDKGRIRLDRKADIMEEFGFSPDKADSLALCFAYPVSDFSEEGEKLEPPQYQD